MTSPPETSTSTITSEEDMSPNSGSGGTLGNRGPFGCPHGSVFQAASEVRILAGFFHA